MKLGRRRRPALAALVAATLALSSPSRAAGDDDAGGMIDGTQMDDAEDGPIAGPRRRRSRTSLLPGASHREDASRRADDDAATRYGPNGAYNPSVEPCPTPSSTGIASGYASLSSLRTDLEHYFHSLTEAPTISVPPTPAPSDSPTGSPTRNPSGSPTPKPSELPTKSPITFRPTNDPTGRFFVPKRPTRSPTPTIKIVVFGGGGGGGGPTGPTGPTGRRLESAPSENLDDLMLLGGMLPPAASPSGRAAPSPPAPIWWALPPISSPVPPVPSLLMPTDQLREEAGLDEQNEREGREGREEEQEEPSWWHRGRRLEEEQESGGEKGGRNRLRGHKPPTTTQEEFSNPNQNAGGKDGIGGVAPLGEPAEDDEEAPPEEAGGATITTAAPPFMARSMAATPDALDMSVLVTTDPVMGFDDEEEEDEDDEEKEEEEKEEKDAYETIQPVTKPPPGPLLVTAVNEEAPKELATRPAIKATSANEEARKDGAADPAVVVATAPPFPPEDENDAKVYAYGGQSESDVTVHALAGISGESGAGDNTRTRDTGHLIDDGDPVHFNICPGSSFDFVDLNDTLVVETPLRNPLAIDCLPNIDNVTNCLFRGGDIHLLINNDGYNDGFEYEYYSLEELELEKEHPVTVTGITFAESSDYSVLMNDPRAGVTFDSCSWENNTATEAVLYVNGTYIKPVPVTTTTSSTIDWGILATEESEKEKVTKNPPRWLMEAEEADGEDYVVTSRGRGGVGSEEEPGDDDVILEGGRAATTTTTATAGIRGRVASAGDDEVAASESSFSETASTAFDWGRFRFQENLEEEMGEETFLSSEDELFDWGDGGEGRGMSVTASRRALEGDGPRSTISLDGCTFSGNKGEATIMVTSYADKAGDAGGTTASHSISLKLQQTSFVSEEVGRSVIVNSGGNLESSRVLFENNVAESLIEAERGAAVEVSRTEFSGNEVTGDGGIVVLDSESELEANEDNCAVDEGDGSGTGNCNGVFEDSVCVPFGEDCFDRAADVPTQAPTAGPSDEPSAGPSSGPSAGPSPGPSFSLAPSIGHSLVPSLSSGPTSGAPTESPTAGPSEGPTTGSPTASPTFRPTRTPTTRSPIADGDTAGPTADPSASPTADPSASPTASPSESPTTGSPTTGPTLAPSSSPTASPSESPSTRAPTTSSVYPPTRAPATQSPVARAAGGDTPSPSVAPSLSPTLGPSLSPTLSPRLSPTVVPTPRPTRRRFTTTTTTTTSTTTTTTATSSAAQGSKESSRCQGKRPGSGVSSRPRDNVDADGDAGGLRLKRRRKRYCDDSKPGGGGGKPAENPRSESEDEQPDKGPARSKSAKRSKNKRSQNKRPGEAPNRQPSPAGDQGGPNDAAPAGRPVNPRPGRGDDFPA